MFEVLPHEALLHLENLVIFLPLLFRNSLEVTIHINEIIIFLSKEKGQKKEEKKKKKKKKKEQQNNRTKTVPQNGSSEHNFGVAINGTSPMSKKKSTNLVAMHIHLILFTKIM